MLTNNARPHDANATSLFWFALHRYFTFQQFHQLTCNRQAQTGAAKGARQPIVNLPKLIEDITQCISGHANPGVLYFQRPAVLSHKAGADYNGTGSSKLHRITHETRKDLQQLAP